MKKGEPQELEFTHRYGHLAAQNSIQSFEDVVVELVTNCDDSYHSEFRRGHLDTDGGRIVIEVQPKRGASPSILKVKDRAGGFSDLHRKIQKVGEKTSGEGDRGFMARGLKDCASLGHVTVETIVDGKLAKAEIDTSFKLIRYISERHDDEVASKEVRRRLGIPKGNGTVVTVEFKPHVRVPRKETIKNELLWHFALRDILADGGTSKVLLKYGQGKLEALLWKQPNSEVVYDKEFEVEGYPGCRARFTLFRSEDVLTPSTGPSRRNGVVLKGERAIHGSTFFKSELERDQFSENYFGRLECHSIDSLAREWDDRRAKGLEHPANNPSFILDPGRRGGLVDRHPFVQRLYEQPIQVIEDYFEEDKRKTEKTRTQVESAETTRRMEKLAKAASKFMHSMLDDEEANPIFESDIYSDLQGKGISISPKFCQLEVEKTRTFYLRVNRSRNLGEVGQFFSVRIGKEAAKALSMVGQIIPLELDPEFENTLRGSFVLKGKSENRRVQIGCFIGGQSVHAEVQVVRKLPSSVSILNNFAFQNRNYTIKLGSVKTLRLRARFSEPHPPEVTFQVRNSEGIIQREIHQFRKVKAGDYYEATITVEARQLGASTTIKAESGPKVAECSVKVVDSDEPAVDLKFELTNEKLGDKFRAIWDRDKPNLLKITTTHPSIKRYLGAESDGYPGQNTPQFRVLLAELVADNVCRRIVEDKFKVRTQEFDSDSVFIEHSSLMMKFTPIAHQIQLENPDIAR